MGNLTKWLCDKLKVVNDDGKDPGSIFRKWFLDKSSQISRRNDLKKVGGILVTSFSPKKMVLTVSFKWRKLTSSSSAISFLKSSKKCQFNINSLNYTCEIDFWDSLGIYFCALCFLMWKSEKRTAKKWYKPSYMWPSLVKKVYFFTDKYLIIYYGSEKKISMCRKFHYASLQLIKVHLFQLQLTPQE